jgi:hypothetical protein
MIGTACSLTVQQDGASGEQKDVHNSDCVDGSAGTQGGGCKPKPPRPPVLTLACMTSGKDAGQRGSARRLPGKTKGPTSAQAPSSRLQLLPLPLQSFLPLPNPC